MVTQKKATTKKKEVKKTPGKKAVKKPIKPVEEEKIEPVEEEIITGTIDEKSTRYIEATGRRKTSVARVRIFTQGEKTMIVNDKPYKEYFPTLELQQIALAALEKMKCLNHFMVSVRVKGGGIHSQAEAVRHGTSRALVEFNPDFRKRLRKAGYITRDPRAKERKKFGLKGARKAPQWSKR
tara:strand:- start:760 stop:1302 length:543 start_codon:yes stop_codon:yes gene_type:complete